MDTSKTDYIWLADDPPTPGDRFPSKEECLKFEFIKMSQLCEISEQKGLGRSRACNAFGGDRGQFKVITDRMARAVTHGKAPRKFVKTSAAMDYLNELGVTNW